MKKWTLVLVLFLSACGIQNSNPTPAPIVPELKVSFKTDKEMNALNEQVVLRLNFESVYQSNIQYNYTLSWNGQPFQQGGDVLGLAKDEAYYFTPDQPGTYLFVLIINCNCRVTPANTQSVIVEIH